MAAEEPIETDKLLGDAEIEEAGMCLPYAEWCCAPPGSALMCTEGTVCRTTMQKQTPPSTVRAPSQDGPKPPFGALVRLRPKRGEPLTAGDIQWKYLFTVDDVLWTARFIIGEAGGRDNKDNRAVIWCMFNRFALHTHGNFKTFADHVRSYSTTLQWVLRHPLAAKRHMNDKDKKGNPLFVRDGDVYPGTDIPKGQLKKFRDLQQTPWKSMSSGARSLAENALKGEIANPMLEAEQSMTGGHSPVGIASDFDNTRVYYRDRHKKDPKTEQEWLDFTLTFAKQKKITWIGVIESLNQQRENAFFINNRDLKLPGDTVQVLRGGSPG